MEWTDALSTGNALLDEHHREIFRWIAELESAATENRTLFGVYVITRLNRYVREHFKVEEALMRQAGYPKLAEHIAEHEAFRHRIGEMHVHSIAREIPKETVDYLNGWLTNHIARTDMEYVPFLAKLGNDR
ncbi:MAG: hemerythrin family protein [Rhodocyclaceae bacterium]|nr:hemerythrin family protein [Rhodocyclaceae bacterium]